MPPAVDSPTKEYAPTPLSPNNNSNCSFQTIIDIGGATTAPPDHSMSTISLSSLPANSRPILRVPMNTPLHGVPPARAGNAGVTGSEGEDNDANGNSELNLNTNLYALMTSCFRPLWPSGGFFAYAQKGPASAAVVDNFEISLEAIEVNFKEDYIGGGNQSSVFRGKLNGRFIALKKLNRASEVDIQRLKALDHPNVIKTLGVCTKDVYPCIVMEYCEEGGLFDVLRRTEVDKEMFCRWSRELAEGMQYLHSVHKIVHRDLKSPNVLVNSKGCLKIADFGSLYTGPWEKTQMPSVVMSVCGTAMWMPPEMLKSEPCNEKVDVWSFGVVLWELLTQEVPYRNINPMAIIFQVGHGRLSLHVPRSAPESVKLLFKLCWSRRPRNRPGFMSILNHLANLRVELEDMSNDAWAMRKEVWKKEIADEINRLTANNSNNERLIDKRANLNEEEVVSKRMHELRHAQEIREMYEGKLQRLNKFEKEIALFMHRLREKEEELVYREVAVEAKEEELKRRCAQMEPLRNGPGGAGCCHNNVASSTRLVEAGFGQRKYQHGEDGPLRNASVKVVHTTALNGKCGAMHVDNAIYSCVPGGRRAVLTMSIQDLDNDTSPEYHVDPVRHHGCRGRGRRSASSSSSSSYNEEKQFHLAEHGDLSQQRARSSRLRSTLHDPSSNSNCQSPKSSGVGGASQPNNSQGVYCPNCHCEYFNRNSLARVSNQSADSGFHHLVDGGRSVNSSLMNLQREEARQRKSHSSSCAGGGAGQLRQIGAHSFEGEGTPKSPTMCRNAQARWSDGRITQHKRPLNKSFNTSRRPISTVFTRDCPARRNASARKSCHSYHGGQQQPSKWSPSVPQTHSFNALPVAAQSPLQQCRNCSCLEMITSGAVLEGMPIGGGTDEDRVEEREVDVDYPVDVFVAPLHLEEASRKQSTWSASPVLLRKDPPASSPGGKRISQLRVDSRQLDESKGDIKGSTSWPLAIGQCAVAEENIDEHLVEKAMQMEIDLDASSSSATTDAIIAAMMTSGSTMISSLERSLEMAVANSDGLSDKETKLKEARKSLLKTHRRTSSNPAKFPTTSGPNQICETSTESDNDQVYC